MPLTLRVTKGFEKNEKVSLAGKDMSVFNHSSTVVMKHEYRQRKSYDGQARANANLHKREKRKNQGYSN